MSDMDVMKVTGEPSVLKGGHMAAKKVGGMRVVRKEKRGFSESEKQSSEDESRSLEDRPEPHANNILASTGLAAQAKKDYPEEAIRSFHEKPVAQYPNPITHDKTHKTHQFQPRKN
uniref:Death-associated protein 1 n=1 Tax=Steinernema glaseri TaxID=37863 RepID=A0A1I7YRQ9_9BILA